MLKNSSNEAALACEAILSAAKKYNLDKEILPRDVQVIDRLLTRRVEMLPAYVELHQELGNDNRALSIFFVALVDAAVDWTPDEMARARIHCDELANLNLKIAEVAQELAHLVRSRDDLHNSTDFASGTASHICDLIKNGAAGNALFSSHVEGPLIATRKQFGLKYWPKVGDIVEALARDAKKAKVTATNPMTAAAIEGQRNSLASFVKAFIVLLDESRQSSYGPLPQSFKLSDKTMATLINCSLGLEDEQTIGADYVKRFRQRQHE